MSEALPEPGQWLDRLLPLRRPYRCAVISGGRQVTQILDQSHAQLVAGLRSARARAISNLGQTRAQNLAAIDAALATTLRSLSAQEYAERQSVNDNGYLKQLAVEQMAHASIAGLAKGIGAAMASLDQLRSAVWLRSPKAMIALTCRGQYVARKECPHVRMARS